MLPWGRGVCCNATVITYARVRVDSVIIDGLVCFAVFGVGVHLVFTSIARTHTYLCIIYLSDVCKKHPLLCGRKKEEKRCMFCVRVCVCDVVHLLSRTFQTSHEVCGEACIPSYASRLRKRVCAVHSGVVDRF